MNAPALHSFVVGVTPEGRRHPLFVGTIGEARAFTDEAEKAGEVAGVYYAQLHLMESVRPTSVQLITRKIAADPPPAPPRTSAVPDAGAGAGAPSEIATAGMPSADEIRSSDTEPGARELSQAAKPGLDGAPTPAPEAKPETRDEFAARLADLPRPALVKEGHALNLTIPVSITNANLRALLVDTKFLPPS